MMRLRSVCFCIIVHWLTGTPPVQASPEQDRIQFRTDFQTRFPDIALPEFANGVYAINQDARESWLAIEEFPPYEQAVEKGERLFNTPFANGQRYADCFPENGIGIAQHYPQWDSDRGIVVTLALAINDCRMDNGEAALAYEKGALVSLLAYMAYTSRGKPTQVVVPNNDPGAVAAYEQGKKFYYARRGQLNFSCATCHVQNAGKQIRAETLSPALGHTTNWPVYRLKWEELGTLHRRFAECHRQIRAKPFPAQSEAYRNLEYFLTYMSNGLPLNGPSTRK